MGAGLEADWVGLIPGAELGALSTNSPISQPVLPLQRHHGGGPGGGRGAGPGSQAPPSGHPAAQQVIAVALRSCELSAPFRPY